MMANVVEITQGETVRDEVLGSGSGGPFQAYALKKKPLTYLASSDPEGLSAVQSTLLVTVSAVQWTERPTLVDSAANASNFTTTLDDSGQTTVVFGDGFSGAIPPSGRNNIRARTQGLGSSGNAAAGHTTTDRQRAGTAEGHQSTGVSGGADPESIDQIKSMVRRVGARLAGSGVEIRGIGAPLPEHCRPPPVATGRQLRLFRSHVQLTVAASDGTESPTPQPRGTSAASLTSTAT
jgi:hypothetical protein